MWNGICDIMVSCTSDTIYQKKGLNLIVIFLLMNSIATFIVQYFILEPLASKNALVPSTESILDSAKLPYLIRSPNKLSVAILMVIGIAILLYFLINKTTFGYEMRAVGKNAKAAKYSGIHIKKNICLYHLFLVVH